MRLTLVSKILIALVGVLMLALFSNIVAIYSARHFERLHETLIVDNLASVLAAEELEIALLNQRGYVSLHLLDGGNRDWLERLDETLQEFEVWLARARNAAREDEENDVLDRLEAVHGEYERKRDEVVSLYELGQEETARQMLVRDVTELARRAFDECEEFIRINQNLVAESSTRAQIQVEQVTVVASISLAVTVILGLALLWLFVAGVMLPLRRLSTAARLATGSPEEGLVSTSNDAMRNLGHYIKMLMTDVAITRSSLEHSRTQLAHAEKLAAVGKLAACVAHEIRNPLTSIKMWLYSLRRSQQEDGELQKTLAIVSDEIGRLEKIVRNFLDFSRPPKLQLKAQPIGTLLDKCLELVSHRLEVHGILVTRQYAADIPPVMADTEQLQQVLLNLINNAIEAMPTGGELRVATELAQRSGQGQVAVRLADNGGGIPENMRLRIFEPFLSTKDDGTGLGLCIAASIMARHGGSLTLESTGTGGTRWLIRIPAAR